MGQDSMNLMQILYINHVLKMDPPNQRHIHLVISYSKLSIQATQQNHLCSELSGMWNVSIARKHHFPMWRQTVKDVRINYKMGCQKYYLC